MGNRRKRKSKRTPKIGGSFFSRDDRFFNLLAYDNIRALQEPDALWKFVPVANFSTAICTKYPEVADALEEIIVADRQCVANETLVIQPIVTLVNNIGFESNRVLVDGKYLLASFAGSRATNYLRAKDIPNGKSALNEALWWINDPNIEKPFFPVLKNDAPNSTPIVLEARNKTNFYHFLVETLSHLPQLQRLDSKADILIHSPDAKKHSFADGFIEELFPEAAHRIKFVKDIEPVSYDQALFPLDWRRCLFSARLGIVQMDDIADIPFEYREKCMGNVRLNKFWHNNVISQGLESLRHLAISLSKSRMETHERIFVDRDDDLVRPDRIFPEDRKRLRNFLSLRGFETVYFEKLSPIDQIRISNSCKVCVMAHGAGMTNMLFAQSDALFVELSNIDSSDFRWNSFRQLATISRARYHKIFADAVGENASVPRRKGLRGIKLTDQVFEELERVLDA